MKPDRRQTSLLTTVTKVAMVAFVFFQARISLHIFPFYIKIKIGKPENQSPEPTEN